MDKIATIPAELRAKIADAAWTRITTGETAAEVWRLTHPTKGIAYLKIAARDDPDSLAAEHERLLWARRWLPVPAVVGYARDAAHDYLLTEGLSGVMPYDAALSMTTEARLTLLAHAARQIHELPVAACPFDATIEVKLALVRQRMAAGRVKLGRFAESHPDRTLASLYDALVARRPAQRDIVVTHGDLYPVNVLVDADRRQLSGFVDVGRMGLADRYTDLALIANTILWHFDAAWLPTFFTAYGLAAIDEERLAYYQFLDKFF